MSAPDLSFWSQMEGTSLFCNSAAFAAAAASEAASAVNNMSTTNMQQSLFNSSNFDPSFHSLAHHLPTTFNLNSLTNPNNADINPFENNSSGQQQQQPQQHQASRQLPPPPQQQQQQPAAISQQQQQHSHHANNFWAAHTNNAANNPGSGNPSPPHPQQQQNHSHQDSIMGTFNPPSAQKLSTDFRTVSLPTSDDGKLQRSPSTYCVNPVIPVSNAIMCQVCLSAPSNGLHFGAKVCAACAAFFRRSVSDAKKYICKRSQRCLLRVNDQTGYRKICRDCRFKRCLEIGMLPENVQHKRHRRDADPTPPLQQQQSQQQPLSHHNPLLGGANSALNNSAPFNHGDYLDLFQQHAVAAAAAAAQQHQQQQQHHASQTGSLPSDSPTINFNMPLSH
uniref:Nuclear receptor domain-containing protein n=1 Tax=Panagrolaimus sp. ES5 TaxID=591445 RepID=A0AC34F6M1_9BILA